MLKLIVLALGLAIGFGVGVWWGVQHPTEAANLSAEEQRRFIEAQIKATEAVKAKLDQIANKQTAQPNKFFGSGLVSGSPASSGPDPEITALRDQQDQQLQDLHKKLDQLNK